VAHPDLTYLLNAVLEPATKYYAQARELASVATTLDAAGVEKTYFADMEGRICTTADEVAFLVSNLKPLAASGQITACAICFKANVEISGVGLTPALGVNLEREGGEAVQVFLPIYERNGSIEYGEIGANDLIPVLFTAPARTPSA
jgi:hypothetical protein